MLIQLQGHHLRYLPAEAAWAALLRAQWLLLPPLPLRLPAAAAVEDADESKNQKSAEEEGESYEPRHNERVVTVNVLRRAGKLTRAFEQLREKVFCLKDDVLKGICFIGKYSFNFNNGKNYIKKLLY